MANEPTPLEDLVRLSGPLDEEPRDWRSLFHGYEECVNAPPLHFAIEGFLPAQGITMIGGLSGHGKTLAMLSMARALLHGTPLFGHQLFSVPERAGRVLYLIPESALGPFFHRIKLFGMEEEVRSGKLLIRTLEAREPLLGLGDARLLAAAQGAYVFLDTAVRFMAGDEDKVSREFAQQLFDLVAAGAIASIGAHHSPKSFEKETFMTLENVLRGSGDIGAMLSTAWGMRQIDLKQNRIYMQNLKPRDFDYCEPFILTGRPYIDDAMDFIMTTKPGEAGELADKLPKRSESKRGAKVTSERQAQKRQAIELSRQGKSLREIEALLKEQYGDEGAKHSTISNWIKEGVQ